MSIDSKKPIKQSVKGIMEPMMKICLNGWTATVGPSIYEPRNVLVSVEVLFN